MYSHDICSSCFDSIRVYGIGIHSISIYSIGIYSAVIYGIGMHSFVQRLARCLWSYPSWFHLWFYRPTPQYKRVATQQSRAQGAIFTAFGV